MVSRENIKPKIEQMGVELLSREFETIAGIYIYSCLPASQSHMPLSLCVLYRKCLTANCNVHHWLLVGLSPYLGASWTTCMHLLRYKQKNLPPAFWLTTQTVHIMGIQIPRSTSSSEMNPFHQLLLLKVPYYLQNVDEFSLHSHIFFVNF